MNSTIVLFQLPNDEKLMAAVGKVALRHEHLNYVLRLTIKSLAGVTLDEALRATEYEGSKQLRECVRKLARKRLGDGQALIKLQAALSKCGELTKRRNSIVHSFWAEDLDGKPHVRNVEDGVRPLPTVQELEDLAAKIEQLSKELNSARLKGFLKDALTGTTSAKAQVAR